jgi:hypothetical protein
MRIEEDCNSSINRGNAHDNPYFHRKGEENAKERMVRSAYFASLR